MDTAAFLAEIKANSDFGVPTSHIITGGIPYFVGQFWTSKQRQGHSLHEISYRGCFKAELPAFFIDRLTDPGDAIYDPFAGRGTTLIEAALTGRRPIGNDINPLWAMLCRPRLNPPDEKQVKQRLVAIRTPPLSGFPPGYPDSDLLHFYHPVTLADLRGLRAYFMQGETMGTLDAIDDWIRMVALNRLTGHSPGFFSVYTLPPSQAASVAAQQKINRDRQQTPPLRDVAALIWRKTRALLRDGAPPPCSPVFHSTSAAFVPVPDASVALVVTSPPFLDVLNYYKDNWLRAWFADVDVSTVPISQLKTTTEWQEMVRQALADLARIVRPGGHVAFEVGEVRRGSVLLEQLVWEAAIGLPFDRIGVIVNGGSFTKTSSIWNVSNNSKGTNTNRVVLLKRLPW